MSDVAIQVEHLSKCYRIGLKEQMSETLGGAIGAWLKAPFSNLKRLRRLTQFDADESRTTAGGAPDDLIWALSDVSFTVGKGEVIGIIGRNGAGKSTLLKILSRIVEPTAGRALISGRVASLLEVGTGFHPELTGRENIYLNGAVLGMTKAEIDSKFDAIVAFAEVEKFLDTPVKRYSSGMRVRLAFAVAAHLEPEILLIDEVLAVGDAAFQKKCIGKMGDITREGRTILFVSHNMAAVSNLCERSIMLEQGRIAFIGDTKECVEAYFNRNLVQSRVGDLSLFRRDALNEQTPAYIQSIRVANRENVADDLQLPVFLSGDDIKIQIEIVAKQPIKGALLGIVLARSTGEIVTTVFSGDKGFLINIDTPQAIYCCNLNNIPLVPGIYTVTVWLNQSTVSRSYDMILNYPLFLISEVIQTGGQFQHRHWGAFYWENVNWQEI